MLNVIFLWQQENITYANVNERLFYLLWNILLLHPIHFKEKIICERLKKTCIRNLLILVYIYGEAFKIYKPKSSAVTLTEYQLLVKDMFNVCAKTKDIQLDAVSFVMILDGSFCVSTSKQKYHYKGQLIHWVVSSLEHFLYKAMKRIMRYPLKMIYDKSIIVSICKNFTISCWWDKECIHYQRYQKKLKFKLHKDHSKWCAGR